MQNDEQEVTTNKIIDGSRVLATNHTKNVWEYISINMANEIATEEDRKILDLLLNTAKTIK